jgi:hypothetical protein
MRNIKMTSKFIKRAGLVVTAAALAFGATAVSANTLTYQGVTFTTTMVDANTFTLQITDALSATGDWAGITNLGALAFKQDGANITGGDITDWTTDTFSPNELNAGACSGGVSGGGCFTFDPRADLTNSMLFTIDFTGTGINTDGIWHLKLNFFCGADATKKCGSNLSMDIFSSSTSSSSGGDVPEPGPMSLTLLGLGLLGAGFMRRARQSS